MLRNFAALSLLALPLLPFDAVGLDRRIVDRATVGDPRSEAVHGYVGHDVTEGIAVGRAFRQARGWMRYAMTTFDDTEVTVALTMAGVDSITRQYDLIVEDSLVATRSFTAKGGTPVVVEHLVPFVLTKGKAEITVVIRGHEGQTPALHEVRTVQDHNEIDLLAQQPSGVVR